MSQENKPSLLIIQPGRFGDIIICAPIAKWYHDQGYAVYWNCPKEFHGIFFHFDYIYPTDFPEDVVMHMGPFDKIIDLSFGFGGSPELWWRERQHTYDSFVTAKYDLAKVPLEERWNFQWKRNRHAEDFLNMIAGGTIEEYPENWDEKVALIHLQGSHGAHIEEYANIIPTTTKKIFFKPIEGFTILDWYKRIEDADEIHCIDSSLANFIEVCPEFKDKKKYLYDIRESYQWLKSIYRNGWTIVK